MALEKPTEELKKRNTGKDKTKAFSKKNAKSRYYSGIGKMASQQRPVPKYKRKGKKEVAGKENKNEPTQTPEPVAEADAPPVKKKGFMSHVYDSLIRTGYLTNLEDFDEPFDKELFDNVGTNKAGDAPDSNLNRAQGQHSGAVTHTAPVAKSSSVDLSALQQPLKAIDDEIKTQAGTFKLISDEIKKHTEILNEIKKNTARIVTDEKKDNKNNKDDKNKKTPDKKLGELFTLLKSVYKTGKDKSKPLVKKVVDKTKQAASKTSKLNLAERAKLSGANLSEKLGGIGSQIRAGTRAASTMASNAASAGMQGGSMLGEGLMSGGRALARVALPALAVAGAGAAGYGAGKLIDKAIDGTAAKDAIGAGVAKTAAFFGDKEAQQAVKDTEKYKNFGALSGEMESNNNAGNISSGEGDAGGKSYGTYQLASKKGSVDKFLQSSGYADQFKGMQVGSAAFDAKWKDLSKTDKNFGKAQAEHATKEYYAPTEAGLKKDGIDLSGRGRAVKEVMMSTGVQYGASKKGSVDLIKKALAGKDVSKMSDKDIIDAIQDYKAATVDSKFRSSSPAVKQGVAKRIEKERKIAKALDDKEKGTSTADVKATPVTDKKTDVKATPVTDKKTDVKATPVDSYTGAAKDKKTATKITSLDTSETTTDENGNTQTLTAFDVNEGKVNGKPVKVHNYQRLMDMELENKIKPFDKDSDNMNRLNILRNDASNFESKIGNQTPTTTTTTSSPQTVESVASNSKSKQSDPQQGADEKGSKLEVRKTPSTIQRIFDRDFHLSL